MEQKLIRGGQRAGAGRKPTWKMGQTKHLKVPEAIEDKVLIAARRIDQEEYKRSQGIKVTDPDAVLYTVTRIAEAIERKESGFVSHDAGRLIEEILKLMK